LKLPKLASYYGTHPIIPSSPRTPEEMRWLDERKKKNV